MTTAQDKAVTVMLVDDSAVVRGATARILEADPAIKVVASVPNGEMAVSAAKRDFPDVVILDIEMPVMDGLTALPLILQASPKSKVVMFSTLTEKGAAVSLKALSLGAVECLVKPSSTTLKGLHSSFDQEIIALVKSLAGARPQLPIPRYEIGAATTPVARPGTQTARAADQEARINNNPSLYKGKPDILAIGSSTGGPQALFNVLGHCQNFSVPIVITQHMPATFTKILAQHIQAQTGIKSQEGENGMAVEPGQIYVAPGGRHMIFEVKDGKTVIRLDDGPAENFCKPAVDPMLRSLLKIYSRKTLCLILTGMGSDGLAGGKLLAEAGARVIAQDEATSVVWGMPGAVAKAGICAAILPLPEIGPWLRQAITGDMTAFRGAQKNP